MATGTPDEREAKWKECLLSIGKRCQVLRSGRGLKPELLNPSCSCSDAENLALVPISNATEENTAAESITTQANVTLEVDKSLVVAQTPPQVNLGLYYAYYPSLQRECFHNFILTLAVMNCRICVTLYIEYVLSLIVLCNHRLYQTNVLAQHFQFSARNTNIYKICGHRTSYISLILQYIDQTLQFY